MTWVGLCPAAGNVVGFFLEQEAFSEGPLASAVAAMTITNPVASYLLAVWHSMRAFKRGATGWLTGAAILIGAGAVGLACSTLVHPQLAHAQAM